MLIVVVLVIGKIDFCKIIICDYCEMKVNKMHMGNSFYSNWQFLKIDIFFFYYLFVYLR